MLRIFVVDDSTFMRKALKRLLGMTADLEHAGDAASGAEALARIGAARPDLVTLDIDMPGMDGLTTLRELRARYPELPVIMLSAHTRDGAKETLEALSIGAVDFIDKSSFDVTDLDQLSTRLLAKLKAWAVQPPRPKTGPVAPIAKEPSGRVRTSGVMRAARRTGPVKSPSRDVARGTPKISVSFSRFRVCVLGASTGGPPAIEAFLASLSASFPLPIVIVQHMPRGFTKPFAERLNGVAQIEVGEAVQGEQLVPGRAVIAPAGRHVRVKPDLTLALGGEPLDHAHIPSCDVLLRSAAESLGHQALGVLLTGMGDDGADGMLAIRRAGGLTLAQDEASSVVYGMPRAAFERGGVSHVLSLGELCTLFGGET